MDTKQDVNDNEKVIFLTEAELQSRHDRQRWAEGLILQLPKDHDGRNSWLLNFGISAEAVEKRTSRKIPWNEHYRAARQLPFHVSGPIPVKEAVKPTPVKEEYTHFFENPELHCMHVMMQVIDRHIRPTYDTPNGTYQAIRRVLDWLTAKLDADQ